MQAHESINRSYRFAVSTRTEKELDYLARLGVFYFQSLLGCGETRELSALRASAELDHIHPQV